MKNSSKNKKRNITHFKQSALEGTFLRKHLQKDRRINLMSLLDQYDSETQINLLCYLDDLVSSGFLEHDLHETDNDLVFPEYKVL